MCLLLIQRWQQKEEEQQQQHYLLSSFSIFAHRHLHLHRSTHFIIYLSFFISFSLFYAIIKTILKHTLVHFVCRKNQSLFSQNDPTLVQAGRVFSQLQPTDTRWQQGFHKVYFSGFLNTRKINFTGDFSTPLSRWRRWWRS